MINSLLERLSREPETVEFSRVIELIDQHYNFTPTRFSNGGLVSQAGENSGSCKIFAFAKLHELSEAETLACFGHYYRDDVLNHPNGEDHQNIRRFMLSGWAGLDMPVMPLSR